MSKRKKQIQEFTVSVMRTSYAFRDIKVQAKSQKEANKLALEEAGDHDYSEKEANYSIAR